jgi:SHS2 domain-containing protein
LASPEEPLYREFEHTGDLGIELEAPTRAELFARAATALARIMVEPDGIRAAEQRTLEVTADTDDDLMHDLLADALNLFLADGFIWSDVAISERGPTTLIASFAGEAFDLSRHRLLTEIKAVTYHELKVERTGANWRARIVFDI